MIDLSKTQKHSLRSFPAFPDRFEYLYIDILITREQMQKIRKGYKATGCYDFFNFIYRNELLYIYDTAKNICIFTVGFRKTETGFAAGEIRVNRDPMQSLQQSAYDARNLLVSLLDLYFLSPVKQLPTSEKPPDFREKAMPVNATSGRVVFIQDTYIAGLSYYEYSREKEGLEIGDFLILQRETENPHDVNAVEIYTKSMAKLGYIPRGKNEAITNLLGVGFSLYARIKSMGEVKSYDQVEITVWMIA